MEKLKEIIEKLKATISSKKLGSDTGEEIQDEANTSQSPVENLLNYLGLKPVNPIRLGISLGGLIILLGLGIFLISGDNTSKKEYNSLSKIKIEQPSNNTNKLAINTNKTTNKPSSLKKLNPSTNTSSTKLSSSNSNLSLKNSSNKLIEKDKAIINFNNSSSSNCNPSDIKLNSLDKLFISFSLEKAEKEKKLRQQELAKRMQVKNKQKSPINKQKIEEIKKKISEELKKLKEKKKNQVAYIPLTTITISGVFCSSPSNCYAITNVGVVRKGSVLPGSEKVISVSDKGIKTDKRFIYY